MRAVASIPTTLAPRPHPGTSGTSAKPKNSDGAATGGGGGTGDMSNSSSSNSNKFIASATGLTEGYGNGNGNREGGGGGVHNPAGVNGKIPSGSSSRGGSAPKSKAGSFLWSYHDKPKVITSDNIDKVPINPDKYVDKFESVTKMLLRKTEHIVKDTEKLRKSNRRKLKNILREEMLDRMTKQDKEEFDSSNYYDDSGFEMMGEGKDEKMMVGANNNKAIADNYNCFYDSFKETMEENYDNEDFEQGSSKSNLNSPNNNKHGKSDISLPMIGGSLRGVTFDEGSITRASSKLGGGGSVSESSSIKSTNSNKSASNLGSPIRTVEFGTYKSPGQRRMEALNSPLPPGWIDNRVNDMRGATSSSPKSTNRTGSSTNRTSSPDLGSNVSRLTMSPGKIDPENAKSKLEWENDLARHILSIFATSNAKSIDEENDLANSNTILDYLDTKRTHNLDNVAHYIETTAEEIAEQTLQKKSSPSKALSGEDKDGNESYSSDSDDNNEKSKSSVQFEESTLTHNTNAKTSRAGTGMLKKKKRHPRQSIRVDSRTGLPIVLEELQKEKPNRNPFLMVNTNTGAKSYAVLKTTTLDDVESQEKALRENNNRPKGRDADGDKAVSRNTLHGIEVSADMANILTSKDMQKEESYTKSSKFRSCYMVKFKRVHDDGFIEEQMVALRGPAKVKPIWFTATGEVYSEWSGVLSHPMGEKLGAQLKSMYEAGLYHQYSGIIFKVLNDIFREKELGGGANSIRENSRFVDNIMKGTYMSRHQDWLQTLKKSKTIRKDDVMLKGTLARSGLLVDEYDDNSVKKVERDLDFDEYGSVDFLLFASTVKFSTHLTEQDIIKYWKQFVFTSLAFATLYVEKGKFNDALTMLMKCEDWAKRDDLLPLAVQYELLALTFDGFGYFFYHRDKHKTCYTMVLKSMNYFEKFDDVEGVAQNLIHVAAAQCHMTLYKDAHATLHRLFAMVDCGRMAMKDATPRQLCLIAVAYHNMAVVQLKLLAPDLACKSSSNARKLAKLCLSYSNRWMKEFEWTHKVALEDLKFHLTMKSDMHPHHTKIMKGLVESMVDPAPPV